MQTPSLFAFSLLPSFFLFILLIFSYVDLEEVVLLQYYVLLQY